MDYKIVVRSYGRANLIRNKTIRFLEEQKDLNLEDSLYIVVHESELALYEESLREVKKAGFIVKKKPGANESVRATREFFPVGTPIFFMDDDLTSLLHFEETPNKANSKKLDCLGKYLEDAFTTLKEIGAESWTVSNARNFFWVAGKPWKEFRPTLMIGGIFGAFNSDLLLTKYGHEEDQERSSRYVEHFGGALIYNWVLDGEVDDRFDGGMQLSADRASVDRTFAICQDLWDTDESFRKYHNPPAVNKYLGFYTTKLKSITQIRKLRPFEHRIWSEFFSDKCVLSGKKLGSEEGDSVFDMFGGNEAENSDE